MDVVSEGSVFKLWFMCVLSFPCSTWDVFWVGCGVLLNAFELSLCGWVLVGVLWASIWLLGL